MEACWGTDPRCRTNGRSACCWIVAGAAPTTGCVGRRASTAIGRIYWGLGQAYSWPGQRLCRSGTADDRARIWAPAGADDLPICQRDLWRPRHGVSKITKAAQKPKPMRGCIPMTAGHVLDPFGLRHHRRSLRPPRPAVHRDRDRSQILRTSPAAGSKARRSVLAFAFRYPACTGAPPSKRGRCCDPHSGIQYASTSPASRRSFVKPRIVGTRRWPTTRRRCGSRSWDRSRCVSSARRWGVSSDRPGGTRSEEQEGYGEIGTFAVPTGCDWRRFSSRSKRRVTT